MKTTKIKKSCWPWHIRNWTRHNFDNSIYPFREEAEKETDQDLQKSSQQLLCDVHEEALNPHNKLNVDVNDLTREDMPRLLFNLIHINKRQASLQAKISHTSDIIAFCAGIIALLSLLIAVWALSISTKNVEEISAVKTFIENQTNYYNEAAGGK